MRRVGVLSRLTMTMVPCDVIEKILDDETIWYPFESLKDLDSQKLHGIGAAVNGVPMGWTPAMDSLIHASLVAWALTSALKQGTASSRALKSAGCAWNVQIDDLQLHMSCRRETTSVGIWYLCTYKLLTLYLSCT